MGEPLEVRLPQDQLDYIAERVAALVSLKRERGEHPDRWLTSREAADHLGISLDALYKLTGSRSVPFVQHTPGGNCFFKRSELDAWREANRG